MAVMDISRLESGKVVEHWDVLQEVPETSDDIKHDVLTGRWMRSGCLGITRQS